MLRSNKLKLLYGPLSGVPGKQMIGADRNPLGATSRLDQGGHGDFGVRLKVGCDALFFLRYQGYQKGKRASNFDME